MIDLENLPEPLSMETPWGYLDRLKVPEVQHGAVILKLAERTAAQAMTAETPTCYGHDHKIFYMPWTKALVPGHVYSEAGVSEVRISGVCEYCFDNMFPEED